MTRRRRFRIRLVALLLLAIVQAQLAIAGYRCPMSGLPGDDAAAAAMAGLPCATMVETGGAIDPDRPALCHQHCQFGSASASSTDSPAPSFAGAMSAPPLFTLATVDREMPPGAWSDDPRHGERPPPLPHTVAHCCRRL